ncbi:DUF4124 domain-containing protein [Cognatilysobacter terrigena]|uniref:DUF4124 domain-containing protein n=1 Tax=Cognatilysobacter terrigena TaxID=2488749 RepID=UPI001414CF51|nr:DUF4124 domain-containing protein [Lysobacter terrigena]
MKPVAMLLLLVTGLAGAASPTVVIYRCVGADGQVTIQNGTKCPKGTREQKRVVETPKPAPVPRPVVAPAAPVTPVVPVVAQPVVDATNATTSSTAGSTPPVTPAPPLPAPPIFVCLTSDAQRYYTEAEQSSRCAPISTVGLDGQSTTDAQACEMVEDHCEAVPEADRCAAWTERRRRAEQALTFSPEQIDQARAELAHVEAMTAKTVCGR